MNKLDFSVTEINSWTYRPFLLEIRIETGWPRGRLSRQIFKNRQLPPCIYLGRSSVILNKLFCYFLAVGTVEEHSLFAGKVFN